MEEEPDPRKVGLLCFGEKHFRLPTISVRRCVYTLYGSPHVEMRPQRSVLIQITSTTAPRASFVLKKVCIRSGIQIEDHTRASPCSVPSRE